MGNDMNKDSIDDEDQDNGVLRDPEFDSGSLLGDGENEDFDPEPTDEDLEDIDDETVDTDPDDDWSEGLEEWDDVEADADFDEEADDDELDD